MPEQVSSSVASYFVVKSTDDWCPWFEHLPETIEVAEFESIDSWRYSFVELLDSKWYLVADFNSVWRNNLIYFNCSRFQVAIKYSTAI